MLRIWVTKTTESSNNVQKQFFLFIFWYFNGTVVVVDDGRNFAAGFQEIKPISEILFPSGPIYDICCCCDWWGFCSWWVWVGLIIQHNNLNPPCKTLCPYSWKYSFTIFYSYSQTRSSRTIGDRSNLIVMIGMIYNENRL